MEPIERKPGYRAYLLRCWEARQSCERSASVWRFSLEDPHSGRLRSFADLDALVAALRVELAGAGAGEGGAGREGDGDGHG